MTDMLALLWSPLKHLNERFVGVVDRVPGICDIVVAYARVRGRSLIDDSRRDDLIHQAMIILRLGYHKSASCWVDKQTE